MHSYYIVSHLSDEFVYTVSWLDNIGFYASTANLFVKLLNVYTLS